MWWRKPEILQTGADYEAGRAESHQLIARLPPHLGEKLLLGLWPGGRAGTWYLVLGTWYLVLGLWLGGRPGRNYFQPQLNGEPPPQQRLLKFIFDEVMNEQGPTDRQPHCFWMELGSFRVSHADCPIAKLSRFWSLDLGIQYAEI